MPMGCVLQLILAAGGVVLLCYPRIRVGGRVGGPPHTIIAGLILCVQLPFAGMMGVAIGGAEGIKAARAGVDPAVATSRFAKKFWWLDLAMAGTTLTVASCIVAAGLREPVYEPPPPDDPIGIHDYRKWSGQTTTDHDEQPGNDSFFNHNSRSGHHDEG